LARPITLKKALKEWRLYLFLLPALLVLVVFSYYPVVSAIFHSFYRWDGADTEQYIGFKHFVGIWHDSIFRRSFVVVFILVVANLFRMIPSIVAAVVIHRIRSDRAQYAYRVLFVVPMIVPALVILLVWKFFYEPNFGVLNRFLDITHLKSLLVRLDAFFGWNAFHAGIPTAWLSTPQLIIPSLIFWGFPWIGVVGVLIYLAGLQAIPKTA